MTNNISLNWTTGIEAEVLDYCANNRIEIALGFPYWNGLCDTLAGLRLATPNGQNGQAGDYTVIDHDDGSTTVTLMQHCASAADAKMLAGRVEVAPETATAPATAPETGSDAPESGSTPSSNAGAGA